MIPLPRLIIRVLLLFFGSIMLLVGLYDLLAPRARYVNSNPAPSAELAAVPASVTVSFSNELAPESNIAVGSTIILSPSGEKVYSDGKKFTAAGPDPGDPQHRTLRVPVDSGLPNGLYWVEWKAVAAPGKSRRSGRFCFAAGMAVPADLKGDAGCALWERDYKWRGKRAALVGGVLLIGLGAFLPRMMGRVEKTSS